MDNLIEVDVRALLPAEWNPRTIPAGEAADAELRASIRHHGLLTPITVGPEGDEEGRYRIVAGTRRVAAVRALVEAGERIGTTVPCLNVFDDSMQRERSTAENTQRAALHPLDEAAAFRAALDAGATEEEVAVRFGCPVRRVRQRLSFLNLAPGVATAFRDGRLTVECARAYTAGDHEQQQHLLARDHVWNRADLVRMHLSDLARTDTSGDLAFVGEETYREAGGRVREDLWSETEGDGWIEDWPILQKCVADRLKALGKAFRAKYPKVGEVTTGERPPSKYYYADWQIRPATPGDEADAALNLLAEAWDEVPPGPERQARRETLAAEHRAKRWEALLKAKRPAGATAAHIGFDREGDVELTWCKPRGKPQTEARKAPAADSAPGGDPSDPAQWPHSLQADLGELRCESMRAQLGMAEAYDLLVYTLAVRRFGGTASADAETGCDISMHGGWRKPTPDMLERREALPLDWLPKPAPHGPELRAARGASFKAFRELAAEQKAVLLTECVAEALDTRLAHADPPFALEALARDMSFRKRPAATAEALWNRLSRPQCDALALEALGPDWVKERKSMKKKAYAGDLEKAFAALEHGWPIPGMEPRKDG